MIDVEIHEGRGGSTTLSGMTERCVNLRRFVASENVEILRIDDWCFRKSAAGSLLEYVCVPSCQAIGYKAFYANGVLRNATYPRGFEVSFVNCETIEADAFQLSFVLNLSFPKLERVGTGAFRLSSLEHFDGPSVTYMDDLGMASCLALRSLHVPSCTVMNDYVLGNSGLTSIDLPMVASLGEMCFADMPWVQMAKLPLVKELPYGSFAYDMTLTWVEAPCVTKVGDEAFIASRMNGLNLEIIEEIGNAAFKVASLFVFTVVFPKLKSLGDYAFDGCQTLVTFNSSTVETLGAGSFRDCLALGNLIIPNVTRAGPGVLAGCFSVSIVVNTDVIPSYLFDDIGGGLSESYQQIEIGEGAFRKNSNRVHLDLPRCVKIGDMALEDCTSLMSVSLPKVQFIGNGVFRRCAKLAKLVLSDLVEPITSELIIGEQAFSGCSSFENIDTSRITEVGSACFIGTPIASCYFPRLMKVGAQAFENTPIERAVFPSAEEVGASAFASCSKLIELSLPRITECPAGLCYSCTSLVNVIASVAAIKDHAFEECRSLITFNFSLVGTISTACFKGCESLTTVIMRNLLSMIGDSHFSGCRNLTYVSLPALKIVPSMSSRVFEDCVKLRRIDLPETPPVEFADDVFLNTHISGCGSTVPITLCLAKDKFYENYGDSQWKHLSSRVPDSYTDVCYGYSEKTPLSSGAIAGIVIAVVIFIAIVVAIVYVVRFFILRKHVMYETTKDMALKTGIISDFG